MMEGYDEQTRERRAISLALLLCAAMIASMLALGPIASDNAYADDLVASDGVTTETQKPNTSKARKYVMIGDSYALCTKKAWPQIVAKRLGLKDRSYKMLCHNGYGFACKDKFVKLLKKQRRNTKVTDVLIVGGAGNDLKVGRAKIPKSYAATIRLIRAKYPNARIMHAIVNWHFKSKSYRHKIVKRYSLYKRLAAKYGVEYLDGCENVLKGHRSWIKRDGNHPNCKGQNAIGTLVAKKIAALG